MTKIERIPEWGALAMVLLAMTIVARLALAGNETALGAMISVVSAGTGFFLRGRVSPPS